MKIIKRRERIEVTTYSRSFEYEGERGAGFAFDCDEHGNVFLDKLQPGARDSYEACLTGTVNCTTAKWEPDPTGMDTHRPIPGTERVIAFKVIDCGVRTYHRSYTEPAVGECSCGEHVELHGFTNTCDKCGADYNTSGQQLAPRSQWGEETGESVADILAIDNMSTERLFED